MFIHGMNERQEQPPAFKHSEKKVIAAAEQLRALNPDQLQLYTIQNDFTRAIYDSGAWFNEHPECLLHDASGSLVNHTQPTQKFPICTAGPNNDTCHIYGFNTQCGRDAWVRFAIDTVKQGRLDGVFIDGFQGCSPHGGCGRALATASPATAKEWLAGLGDALWDLHRQLAALGNKTIICNGTGEMWACEGKTPCYCDAANKERFYPNEHDLEQVVAAAGENNGRRPYWGIIHVPHIDNSRANFNKSLAGFLATAGGAGTPFGFGLGFEYDCEAGGWMRDFPELHQRVGSPTGPPNVSNVINLGRNQRAAVFTRLYKSGVRAYFNATISPRDAASCVRWADGSFTDANSGCEQMELHWQP
eukprot:COSAG02_NODE_4491_length_5296_cov_107.763299_1_plen_360_part_00